MKQSKKTPEPGHVYRVRSADGGWDVFDRGEHRVSERMRTQADAVAHAKELARRDGSAQIIVYDAHGGVASEFFYQREERPALAYDDSARSTAASHAATAGEIIRDPRGGR
jgi:hypothetical protein